MINNGLVCSGQLQTKVMAEAVAACAYLDESNVLGVLLEALTADVEAVLADETVAVRADAAEKREKRCDEGERAHGL